MFVTVMSGQPVSLSQFYQIRREGCLWSPLTYKHRALTDIGLTFKYFSDRLVNTFFISVQVVNVVALHSFYSTNQVDINQLIFRELSYQNSR